VNRFKIVLAVLCVFGSVSLAKTYDQVGTRRRALKNYGRAQVSVARQSEVVYSFRCDIKGWPAIIGKDIPVRIAGVQLPDIVAEQSAPNKFFRQQTTKFLTDFLKGSKKIELANIRRGRDFCLVADVIADSNSLAEILIEKGLAKKVDKTKLPGKINIKVIANTKTPALKDTHIIAENTTWVASSNSKIFHTSTCSFAKRMKKGTAIQFPSREKATETGRRPCKNCKP
jgi:micrococcal nuclease